MYDRSISPHATGGEACSWHEHADTATIEHRIFQRLPVVAERLWGNAKLNKNERTLPRLAWGICRLKKLRGLRVASVFQITALLLQLQGKVTQWRKIAWCSK